MDERVHRRRRVRHHAGHEPADPDRPGGEPDTGPAAGHVVEALTSPPDWTGDPDQIDAIERGLRGLIGGGSSQISPTTAMRARDAARPRPEDLARAAAELTIVRRHWVPRDP